MDNINNITITGYIQGQVKTFDKYIDNEGKPTLISFDIAAVISKKNAEGKYLSTREYYHCIAQGNQAKRLYDLQTAYLANREMDETVKGNGIIIEGKLLMRETKCIIVNENGKNKFIPLTKASEEEKQNGTHTTFNNMTVIVENFNKIDRVPTIKEATITGRVRFGKDQETIRTFQNDKLIAVKFSLEVAKYNFKTKKQEYMYVPVIGFNDVAKNMQKCLEKGAQVLIKGVLTSQKNSKNGIEYKNEGIIARAFYVMTKKEAEPKEEIA